MKHFIINEDCFEVLKKMKIKVDSIIVDPPYNTSNKNTKILKGRKAISSDFGNWDYFSNDEFLIFTKKWLELCKDVLKDNGNILIFSKLEYISEIKRIYESLGFKHHGTMIWHKTNPVPQIRKTGFLSSCEAILWATKGFDNEKISYTFNFLTQKEMHNFIETPICMGRERTKHPTQKPKKLISHLVKIFSNENDIILDCFAGSGTLLESANELKRNSINIEKDKDFFNILKNRINNLNNIEIKEMSLKDISKLKF